jgi:hypothetical protein
MTAIDPLQPFEVSANPEAVIDHAPGPKTLVLPCHDRSIFQRGHWQPMREVAALALSAMGPGGVKALLAEFSR